MASRLRHTACVLNLYCLLSFFTVIASGEKYTALKDLEQILYAENGVAQDLKTYIAKEEARLQKLKSLANDFEEHSSAALANPIHHLGNPVNAFLLVKRFTTDWDFILTHYIKSSSLDSFIDNLTSRTDLFPDKGDLDGAAEALLRLQDTYALPTQKIVQGDLMGVQKSPVLSAEECFELGRHSYNKEDYYHTILWMQAAQERWDEEDYKTVPKADILDYLAYASSVQGNLRTAYNLTIEWLREEPNHSRAQGNLKYYENLLEAAEVKKREDGEAKSMDDEPFKNERHIRSRNNNDFGVYESLCRGEETHERPDRHKLYCSFRFHHPIFYIRPLREEIMNFKPWIAVYHDVLTESEIEKVKELASPRLHRSGVFTLENSANQNIHRDFRTSKSAWLNDWEDPLIQRLSQRTRHLTNLTLDTVEQLQVVNYGIGGHYEPHYDFARKEEVSSFDSDDGNRILTAIYYMTDVEAGGYTVFPAIGVFLKPVKGACGVWFNLLRSGEGDFDTRHAGCPVLTGTKWICNKWFHERGQEWTRPCGQSQEE